MSSRLIQCHFSAITELECQKTCLQAHPGWKYDCTPWSTFILTVSMI